jgi:hypothetical protein
MRSTVCFMDLGNLKLLLVVLISGSSQFLQLPQLPLKMKFDSIAQTANNEEALYARNKPFSRPNSSINPK